MGTAQRSRIGFAVVLLIVVVIGVVAYLNGRNFIETNRVVTHTVQVELSLAELHALALDVETSARGFFITADETYLEPFTEAVAKIPTVVARLQRLVVDNTSQSKRLVALEAALETRLEIVIAAIERRRTMSLDDAILADGTLARGKAQMEEFRRLVAEMQAEEDRLYQDRNRAAENISTVTFFTYGVLTLLAILMLALVYTLIQRSFSESRRIESELERRVAERTRQLQFLADASSVLTEPSAYQQRLNQLAQMAVAQIADICIIFFADNADVPNPTLEPVVLAHRDPSKLSELFERTVKHPPGPDNPGGVYSAFSTGKTIYYHDVDALASTGGPDAPQMRIMQQLNIKSIIIVPIITGGKRLGVMTLVMDESRRTYTTADVTLAEDLAYRAGLLVENGRLFAHIRALNAELEARVKDRTQQLEAINSELEAFNYSVSHDLRAPLRSIDGFSQALLEDYGESMPPPAQSYLNRVRAAAQRMGNLIDDLLSLSRITRVEMTRGSVDISKISREIIEDLKSRQPDRQIAVDIESDLTSDGDPHLVEIMLENLIGNAWKFTRKASRPQIIVGKSETDGQQVFFVRDNGAGFDMSYVNRLFGAFERLHSTLEFEGTGIGLATVRRIINRHGGRVWAESVVGEGATFYFTLT